MQVKLMTTKDLRYIQELNELCKTPEGYRKASQSAEHANRLIELIDTYGHDIVLGAINDEIN